MTGRPLATTAVALLLSCAPAPPPSTPRGAAALRIATWNVHDLFDAVDRTAPPGEQDEVPTAAAVEAKLDRVARVLARIDADVVVLQEVENLAVLERLGAAAALAGSRYRAVLVEGRDPRGIDVGALSRVAFELGPDHLGDRGSDGTALWSRPPLELHLPGARLALLGAHLVSRRDPGEDGRRRDQARRLAELGRALVEGSLDVIVLGDLNDLPTAPALAPLLGAPGLVDLGRALPDADGWTWSGGGARERIDYVLLSEGAAALPLSTEVVAGPDVAAASDHRPVVVDLWLGEPAR